MIAGTDTDFLEKQAASTYKDHGQSKPWKERGVQLVKSQKLLQKGEVENQDNEQPF
jgi:hypothetical protein